MLFVPSTFRPDPVMHTVVRVTADGDRSVHDLASALRIPPDEVRVLSTAVSSGDGFHVLALRVSKGVGRRAVLSFDNNGRLLHANDIDERDLAIEGFAMLDMQRGLVVGADATTDERRMTIVGREGQVMHDLALPLSSGGRSRSRLVVEKGADDLVYVAEDPGRRLLAVSSSGEVMPRFELVGPSDLPLTALRFSHGRVAAFYEGPDRERAGAMIRWAVVHDMATGRHVATYGPLPHMVVCYGASGGVDQFTMLRFSDRQWQLLAATAQ